MRRALKFVVVGFVAGYLSVYAVFLGDAIATPHFEALYGGHRPQGVAAWLQFQHASESVFIVAGVIVAILAALASAARPQMSRRSGAT